MYKRRWKCTVIVNYACHCMSIISLQSMKRLWRIGIVVRKAVFLSSCCCCIGFLGLSIKWRPSAPLFWLLLLQDELAIGVGDPKSVLDSFKIREHVLVMKLYGFHPHMAVEVMYSLPNCLPLGCLCPMISMRRIVVHHTLNVNSFGFFWPFTPSLLLKSSIHRTGGCIVLFMFNVSKGKRIRVCSESLWFIQERHQVV